MEEKLKEQESETIFEKGIGLEKEFCEYLKSDLGWEKARIRSQMASKFNMRGTNVDVIAERLDNRGERLKKLGNFYMIICILTCLIGLFLVINNNSDGMYIIFFGTFVLIIGIISFKLSENLNKENAWVECKNLKTKVNISQVQKTIDEINHYKASENKEYKFVEVYFISSNGFVENALKLAIDNKIICYIKENEKFKKIDYWNH
ncbi:hypothetical protein [Flavobacterium eburneipallidum]|uniref:hypothetical protein n=1 Tax=Flavobacterium eburneipallidum TaxID=3003263 RepID=UPI0022AC2CB4|nr:hypothetical protein [Flavobacterium eburneipallidum]